MRYNSTIDSMTIHQINIEDGIFGIDLRSYLWWKQSDTNFNQPLRSLLGKLCLMDLGGDENTKPDPFSDAEKELLLSTDILTACHNKEIRARWCDYVQVLDKQKRPAYLKQAALDYFDLYTATEDYGYAVRGLQLVRKAKSLFTAELPAIYQRFKTIIRSSTAPFWVRELATPLAAVFGKECCQDFSPFFEEKVSEMTGQGKYEEARHYLDALHLVGGLDATNWRLRRAENYESEGDTLRREKPKNTYYPNLSGKYLNALREIRSLPDSEMQRQRLRLETKVAEASAENYDMIRKFGAPMTPSIDYNRIQEIIAELNIDSFETGYSRLMRLPIVSETDIRRYVQISKSNSSPLTELFSGTERIDQHGAKVSSAAGDDVHLNNARRFIRDGNIAFIRGLKNTMDIFKTLDRSTVFQLIYQTKSRFIPEDRSYVFAEGLSEGFQNEHIACAHLLMPQLENSFRYIALQNGIQTTKWTSAVQQQNMFGGCLEKIKTLTDSDLYNELHHFFVDGDTNFRNELCHGVMTPALVDYYGPYFWWLTLKLVFQTEHYFSFPLNEA